MKEDWINNLHDMMADYQSAVPEGLLEDVKREMTHRGLKSSVPLATQQHPHKIVPLWLRTTAAIAIVILVSMTAWLTFHDNKTEGNKDISKRQHELQETPSEILSTYIAKVVDSQTAINYTSKVLKANAQADFDEIHAETTLEETPVIPSGQEKEEKSPVNSERKKPTDGRNYQERHHQVPFPTRQRQNKGQLAFSGYISGGMGSNNNGKQTAFFASSAFSDAANSDTGMPILYAITNEELLKSTVDGYNKADHHEPIKAGVSLRIPFNSRWSLTTGLNYSYLTSDFTYGSSATVIESTQKLHYLGIPVNVNYSFYQTRRLNIYASAGGEVAKLVSGKKETDIPDKESSEKEDVKESRPQFSSTLSVGAEYRIAEQLSLYAEPGVIYYFDNGSDVENIYKDKPFNFNLQVGLRWTLK